MLQGRRSRLADFDLDGDLDVAVDGGFGGPRFSYLNDGTGFFTLNQFLPLPPGTLSLKDMLKADVDCDGDIDLIFNGDDRNSRVLLNE